MVCNPVWCCMFLMSCRVQCRWLSRQCVRLKMLEFKLWISDWSKCFSIWIFSLIWCDWWWELFIIILYLFSTKKLVARNDSCWSSTPLNLLLPSWHTDRERLDECHRDDRQRRRVWLCCSIIDDCFHYASFRRYQHSTWFRVCLLICYKLTH